MVFCYLVVFRTTNPIVKTAYCSWLLWFRGSNTQSLLPDTFWASRQQQLIRVDTKLPASSSQILWRNGSEINSIPVWMSRWRARSDWSLVVACFSARLNNNGSSDQCCKGYDTAGGVSGDDGICCSSCLIFDHLMSESWWLDGCLLSDAPSG